MKNIVFRYLLHVKSLAPDIRKMYQELSTIRKGLKTIPEQILFYVFICPLSVLVFLVLFVILVIGFLLALGRQIVAAIISLNTVTVPLSAIYTQNYISEMICHILMENARELEIVAPVSIMDILPVKHTLLRVENGFSYYNYIVQHQSAENVNIQDLQELLNLKICQHLQTVCSNYQILYHDMPVIYVFRMAESIHHKHCYSICVMLVDTEEKYMYLRSLEAQNTAAVATTLQDEDF